MNIKWLLCMTVACLIALIPTQAAAQERLAVLEFTSTVAEPDVLAQITDAIRAGSLEAIHDSGSELSMMTRENMLAIHEIPSPPTGASPQVSPPSHADCLQVRSGLWKEQKGCYCLLC